MFLTGLSRLIHSRQLLVGTIAVAAATALAVTAEGGVSPFAGDRGLGLPSVNEWLKPGYLSTCLSLACICGVAMMLVMICKTYNPQRSMSMLWGTMYVVMLLAEPSVVETFYGGTVMAVFYAAITMILFSVYGEPLETRRVFLIFFLLAGGALTQYAYLFYVPMLLIGCLQMRVLTVKVALAAVIGVVTPVWIAIGFGIVDPRAIELPELESAMGMFDQRDMLVTVTATVLTAISGVVFLILNLMKIISYNSAARARNGFLGLSLLLTVGLISIDFYNFAFYLPLLCMLSGYQVSHFFASHRSPIMAIPAGIIILLFVALFIRNTLT